MYDIKFNCSLVKTYGFYYIVDVYEKYLNEEKLNVRYAYLSNENMLVICSNEQLYDYIDKGRMFVKSFDTYYFFLDMNITKEFLGKIVSKFNNFIEFLKKNLDIKQIQISDDEKFCLILDDKQTIDKKVKEHILKTSIREVLAEVRIPSCEKGLSFLEDYGLKLRNLKLFSKNAIYFKEFNEYLFFDGIDVSLYIIDTTHTAEEYVKKLLKQTFYKGFSIKYVNDFMVSEVKVILEKNKFYLIYDGMKYYVKKKYISLMVYEALFNRDKDYIHRLLSLGEKNFSKRQLIRLSKIKEETIELRDLKMSINLRFILTYENGEFYLKILELNKKRKVEKFETTLPNFKYISNWFSNTYDLYCELKNFEITEKEFIDFIKKKKEEYQLSINKARELLKYIAQNGNIDYKENYNQIIVYGKNRAYRITFDSNRVIIRDAFNNNYICIIDDKQGQNLNIYDKVITRILALINDEKLSEKISTI